MEKKFKMNYVKIFSALFACMLLLTGCDNGGDLGKSTAEVSSTTQKDDSSNKKMENVEPKVFSISEEHKLFIDAKGRLWGWGDNEKGELGLNRNTKSIIPSIIMTDVKAMIAGTNAVNVDIRAPYSIALKNDGTLWSFGSGGSLGTGDAHERRKPTQIMTDVKSIFAKDGWVCAIKDDGTLWGWGDGKGLLPKQIETDVKTISFGNTLDYPLVVLKNDNTLWTGSSKIMDNVKTIASLSYGNGNNYAIKNDNTLWVWGKKKQPIQIMTDVRSISAGWEHILVLKNDATLCSCGNNKYGQLGTGNAINTTELTQVMTNVQDISAGTQSSFAITNDGVLWAWGKGGALGSGNRNDQLTPVEILKDVKTVSTVGKSAGVAIKNDDTVWAWGDDIDYSSNYTYAPVKQLFQATPNESGENGLWTPAK